MNQSNQNATSSDSATVADEDTLARLNDLLADDQGVSVGERESGEFEELYVLPDPDPESGVHVVMGLSAEDELSHVKTFDSNDRTTTPLANSVVE